MSDTTPVSDLLEAAKALLNNPSPQNEVQMIPPQDLEVEILQMPDEDPKEKIIEALSQDIIVSKFVMDPSEEKAEYALYYAFDKRIEAFVHHGTEDVSVKQSRIKSLLGSLYDNNALGNTYQTNLLNICNTKINENLQQCCKSFNPMSSDKVSASKYANTEEYIFDKFHPKRTSCTDLEVNTSKDEDDNSTYALCDPYHSRLLMKICPFFEAEETSEKFILNISDVVSDEVITATRVGLGEIFYQFKTTDLIELLNTDVDQETLFVTSRLGLIGFMINANVIHHQKILKDILSQKFSQSKVSVTELSQTESELYTDYVREHNHS